MLSKKEIQFIRSLGIKKYRQKYHKYFAEGEKSCREIILDIPDQVETIYGLSEFYEEYKGIIEQNSLEFKEISSADLKRVSFLKSPNKVLSIVNIPQKEQKLPVNGLSKILFLDNIRDPGNMGTIFRSAEWFGIELLILSPSCVDPYNPKVVQASMGSLFRMKFIIGELNDFLENSEQDFHIYFADMHGSNAFESAFLKPLILVLGNESRGISLNLKDHRINTISIPGAGKKTESLNVGVAASILIAEIFKKGI